MFALYEPDVDDREGVEGDELGIPINYDRVSAK